MLGSVIIVSFAILLSLNLVLLHSYINQRRTLSVSARHHWHTTAHGLGGTAAAILGIGCATCGTAILFGMLGMVGGTGLIAWLPLHGEEFGIFGVLVLGYSAWYTLGKLASPNVCAS